MRVKPPARSVWYRTRPATSKGTSRGIEIRIQLLRVYRALQSLHTSHNVLFLHTYPIPLRTGTGRESTLSTFHFFHPRQESPLAPAETPANRGKGAAVRRRQGPCGEGIRCDVHLWIGRREALRFRSGRRGQGGQGIFALDVRVAVDRQGRARSRSVAFGVSEAGDRWWPARSVPKREFVRRVNPRSLNGAALL